MTRSPVKTNPLDEWLSAQDQEIQPALNAILNFKALTREKRMRSIRESIQTRLKIEYQFPMNILMMVLQAVAGHLTVYAGWKKAGPVVKKKQRRAIKDLKTAQDLLKRAFCRVPALESLGKNRLNELRRISVETGKKVYEQLMTRLTKAGHKLKGLPAIKGWPIPFKELDTIPGGNELLIFLQFTINNQRWVNNSFEQCPLEIIDQIDYMQKRLERKVKQHTTEYRDEFVRDIGYLLKKLDYPTTLKAILEAANAMIHEMIPPGENESRWLIPKSDFEPDRPARKRLDEALKGYISFGGLASRNPNKSEK
jgi:hypothetical protein